jgi:hypothetical protein
MLFDDTLPQATFCISIKKRDAKGCAMKGFRRTGQEVMGNGAACSLHVFYSTRGRPQTPCRSYHIVKAQTYCFAGDVKTGVKHAMQGMKMAESFHSTRYVMRLRQLCERLSATSIYDRTLKELYREVLRSLEKMSEPREEENH